MRSLFTIILISVCLAGIAEVPVLERLVNLNLTNESIVGALEKIEKQTGCIFSYQSNILQGSNVINREFKNMSVREVLSVILSKTLSFKAKGTYIIIKERQQIKTSKTEMSGYVYEANSGKKLANVTIYDKKTLQSVTTDEYGFYSISLPTNNQCLTVNKLNYEDTCVALMSSSENSLNNIAITPVRDPSRLDSVLRKKFRDLSDKTNDVFKKFKGYINTLNVKDTLVREFQFSVIPYVGTNGMMSGSVYNRFSVNLIGGYSRGNKLLEVGTVFNINKENMRGAQAAGMFNIVGDSVSGVQLAGFFNVTGGTVKGAQGAGFANINSGNVKGVEGAGFMNVNGGNFTGVAGSAFMNINGKNVRGALFSGFMNITGDTLRGSAAAGFMNVTELSHRSLEVAGFLNATQRGNKNVQIASFMNITDEGTTRLQVSGFLNKAKKVKGAQIGIINICDSIEGIPIGLISIVKSGIHQLEISGDETFYTNASLRLGVNEFYNVLSYGIQPSGENFWYVGYGIGTSFKLAEKWRGDLSLHQQHVNSGGFFAATSELYKLYLGAEYRFGKKLSVAFGPTFNLYISDMLTPEYANTYSKLAPYTHYEYTTYDDYNLKGWVGGKLAIRFF